MPKLNGPCMSLGAQGTLGKVITYARRKGMNVARQRVDPANPNSPDQIIQRGYIGTLNAVWHAGDIAADDKAAFNRRANRKFPSMNGWNLFCHIYIPILVSAGTPIYMYGITAVLAAGDCTISGTASVGTKNVIAYAYSKQSGAIIGQCEGSISEEKVLTVDWEDFPGEAGDYIMVFEKAGEPNSETGFYVVTV